MVLFGNNNFGKPEENAEFKPDKTFQTMMNLVGDKSLFGKHYKKICEMLKMRKVPPSRFPSMEHFMSRLLSSLDEEKFSAWLKKYVEMEAIDVEEDEDKEWQVVWFVINYYWCLINEVKNE